MAQCTQRVLPYRLRRMDSFTEKSPKQRTCSAPDGLPGMSDADNIVPHAKQDPGSPPSCIRHRMLLRMAQSPLPRDRFERAKAARHSCPA